jgi:hypothetical protein
LKALSEVLKRNKSLTLLNLYKNHIRNDNRLDNLEWVSSPHNKRDIARKRCGGLSVQIDTRAGNRKPCWHAKYKIYPNGLENPGVYKRKSSTNKQVCIDWLENIKKEEKA